MPNYTPNLKLAKPLLSEKALVDHLNGNADILDSLIASLLRGMRYNYLDNSDFTNVVNQRGQTSYTGSGYTIDRWRISNAYATVTVGNKYVLFAAKGGTAIPRQYVYMTTAMYDKVYTVALCTNGGNITIASGLVTSDAVSSETTVTSATVANGVTLRLTKVKAGVASVRLDITDGNSVALRWIALYEGQYTADTLPPYMPKGYETELRECQRDAVKLSRYTIYPSAICSTNGTQTGIPLPIEMRGTPSVESGNFVVYSEAGAAQTDFTFGVATSGMGFVRIDASKSGHGLSGAALRADTDIILAVADP